MQAAQGEGAESARITQAYKGSGGGVPRFHLIGNEEPLKDLRALKTSQDGVPGSKPQDGCYPLGPLLGKG